MLWGFKMSPHKWVVDRKENILATLNIIREYQPIDHNDVMGLIMEIGVTEKTAASYLRALQLQKKIVYEGQDKTWKISMEP